MLSLRIKVQLGDFEFQTHELPESINFGGEQRCAVHEMVGGERVVDAMGRSESMISWSGLFFGDGAVDRARFLDTLRSDGQPLDFQYGEFYYTVLIKSFEAQFQRSNKVPYTLSLLVIENLTDPVRSSPLGNFIDDIMRDIQDAMDIADAIRNPSISTATSLLNDAAKVLPGLKDVTQPVVNNILRPLSEAQSQVGSAISALSKNLF